MNDRRRGQSTSELGRRFEEVVAQRLSDEGWHVLDRNVRFGRKEIDLVARRGPIVAFVEVKGRTNSSFGDPLESITRRKRREIIEVARWWVARFGRPGWIYRFDAASVIARRDGSCTVRVVEDAWRLE